MPSFLQRVAFGAGLTLGIAALPALAATPYDPVAQGIDRVCNAVEPSAAPRDVVSLARIPTHDGSVPNWKRTDAAENDRLRTAANFPGGDFATVIFDRGSIVIADTVHADGQTTDTQTRAWCFIGGKLSRATIETFEATVDTGWRRRLYYGDDLTKPLSEYVGQVRTLGPPNPKAKPPLDTLTIDAWATPAKLPFYDAAMAAFAVTNKRSR